MSLISFLIAGIALKLVEQGHFQMSEDSEKMMLLLKELAVLKKQTQQAGEPQSAVTVTKRKKEITREMKRLARACKQKAAKGETASRSAARRS